MKPIVIIETPPRLDATGAPVFSSFVQGLVEAGAIRLVLNFSTVTYLGSSGVRALMLIGKALAAQDGRLVLLAPHPNVKEVLGICGLTGELTQVDSMEEARTHL